MTRPFGQNVDDPQPNVRFAAASALIEDSWRLLSSSVNGSADDGGTSRKRTRNEAIWARVTSPSGQKRPPPQPLVMPSAASHSIWVRKRESAMSLNVGAAAAAGAGAEPMTAPRGEECGHDGRAEWVLGHESTTVASAGRTINGTIEPGRPGAMEGARLAAGPFARCELGSSVRPGHGVEARWRKAAIWPRVTIPFGQNVVGPQPKVIPAARILLMFASCRLPSSSVK